MQITQFHHVSVNANGVPIEELITFYRDILGLADKHRPEIPGVPGQWKSVGDLELHLVGSRLNFILKDLVPLSEIVPTLLPLLQDFKNRRQGGEGFGDYCQRLGAEKLQMIIQPVPV